MAVNRGEIVFRQWTVDGGMREVQKDFGTLEELFQFCISAEDPLLVDRVYIDGSDNEGNARRLTLVFQSVTISDAQ